MRRLAWYTLAVCSVVAGVLALYRMREAAATLALALVIGAAANPLIATLQRRLPRWVAVAMVYLSAVLVVAGVVALALVVVPAGGVGDGLQQAFAATQARWPGALAELEGSMSGIGGKIMAASTNVLRAVVAVMLALIISLCWTLGAAAIERLWLSLVPPRSRTRVRRVWRAVLHTVGQQARSDIAQTLLTLPLLAALLAASRTPYALVAALAVAALRIVPAIGPLAGVVVATICGAAGGVVHAFVAAVLTTTVLASVHHFVGRRIVASPPPRLIVAASMLLTVAVAGPLGLLAAPVLAAAATALLARWLEASEPLPEPVLSLPDLCERAELLKRTVDGTPAVSPAVVSLVARLDALIGTLAAASEQDTR